MIINLAWIQNPKQRCTHWTISIGTEMIWLKDRWIYEPKHEDCHLAVSREILCRISRLKSKAVVVGKLFQDQPLEAENWGFVEENLIPTFLALCQTTFYR